MVLITKDDHTAITQIEFGKNITVLDTEGYLSVSQMLIDKRQPFGLLFHYTEQYLKHDRLALQIQDGWFKTHALPAHVNCFGLAVVAETTETLGYAKHFQRKLIKKFLGCQTTFFKTVNEAENWLMLQKQKLSA